MAYLLAYTAHQPLGIAVGHLIRPEEPLVVQLSDMEGTISIILECPDFGPGIQGWGRSSFKPSDHRGITSFAHLGMNDSFPMAKAATANVMWKKSKTPSHVLFNNGKWVGVEALAPEKSPRFWGNLLRLNELKDEGPWCVKEEGVSQLPDREVYFALAPPRVGEPHDLPLRQFLPIYIDLSTAWPDWVKAEGTGPDEVIYNHVNLVERSSPCPWVG